MRLAPKLTWPFAVFVLMLLALSAWDSTSRQAAAMEGDMRRDHLTVGRMLVARFKRIFEGEGLDHALAFVERSNRDQRFLTTTWVLLQDLPKEDAEPLARGEELFRVERLPAGKGHVRSLFPLSTPGLPPSAIEVSEPLSEEHALVQATVRQTVALASAIALFGMALVAAVGSLVVVRPMRKIVEKARRIGRGDLSGPLLLRQKDELGELAGELNKMCDELSRTTEQLRHADRLTTVGKLASGLAHELGTPLNVVSARARMLASGEATDVAENARIIAAQSEQMTRIIRQLLDFARRRVPERSRQDVLQLSREAATLLEPLAAKRHVRVTVEGEQLHADVDPGQLQQVLTNLLMNGLQAMPNGGALSLTVSAVAAKAPADVQTKAERFARIEVLDTGVGIAPEVLPHVFEPFFTTKDVGEGTGLGLSVSYGLIREHGGWIEAASEPGKGSRFSLFIPL